ncbi:MAG: DNA pilot protein [Microvirus sp.]|nr:MAG: DNA pilot protein [Microvirus sp.]
MDPVTGGLISGGLSMLGNLFGQNQQNKFNQEMQVQAQAYNTQMSNTAYQRASSDMKAAGLNPMMMFGSGQAASSPTTQPALKTSAISGVGGAVSQAVSTAVSQATVNKLVEEVAKTKAETATQLSEAELNRKRTLTEVERAFESAASAGEKRAGMTLKDAVARKENATLPVAIKEGVEAGQHKELLDTAAGRLLNKAGFAGHKVGQVLSPVTNLVGSAKSAKWLFGDRYGNW